MSTAPSAGAAIAILVLTLAACTSQTGEAAQQFAHPLPSESPSPVGPRIATGILTSTDGNTTGRVEVRVEDLVDERGDASPLATVEFTELSTPYEHLTPGGSLAPRGDDPCFDSGLRAGGGMIIPDENGSATVTIPAEAEGNSLYEIVLHLDWTQVDSATEICMQPVVARAPLTWND